MAASSESAGGGRAPLWIGRQLVEAEGDDVLVLRGQGDISSEESRQLIALDREQARRNGYSLILIDARKVTGFGAGARQAMFEEMKRHSGYLGSTAIFGIEGALFSVMKLVIRGVSLLSIKFDDEMQIFSTEAEARAFLAKRRPQRQQQAAKRRASER